MVGPMLFDYGGHSLARLIAVLLTLCFLAHGCARITSVKFSAPPDRTWDVVERDRTECEASVASMSTAVEEGAKVGSAGALWLGFTSAAEGAAQGAIWGGGRGAADGSWIGAAAGVFVGAVVGVVAGVQRANAERRPLVEAYKSCLRDRGYAIGGETNDGSRQPPSSSPATVAESDDFGRTGATTPLN
jgi:hypothetical protein